MIGSPPFEGNGKLESNQVYKSFFLAIYCAPSVNVVTGLLLFL